MNELAIAVGHLRGGRAAEALTIAEALARKAPFAPDVQQLMAMALSALGDTAGAEQAMRKALALAPHDETLLLNVASWLRGTGKAQAALDLLDAAPASVPVLTQQGLILLQLEDPARARTAFERAISIDPGDAISWHGLGKALRAQDDVEAAASAFCTATELDPHSATTWINLGVMLRLMGRTADSLDSLRRAEELGYSGPELQDVMNGVLADSGRMQEALSGALRMVDAWPDFAQGHETLAHILLEHGDASRPHEEPLARFRKAADLQPDNRDLQLRFLRMLLVSGRAAEALERTRHHEHGGTDDPVRTWLAAEAHDALAQHDRAGPLYASAYRSLAGLPAFLNAYARHSFMAGQFDHAQTMAGKAVALEPGNQEAWSHLGTAWRLANDDREQWLCDYERLIGHVEVETPPGFADQSEFLAAVTTVLDPMHAESRQRLHQSVRNGSQTAGQLFGCEDRVIAATRNAMEKTVTRWIAGLPNDPGHPFLSRKQGRMRFSGSWSVRLGTSGRHVNHIHGEGWMSSAFYVSLPPAVRNDQSEDHAGWLQLGQPAQELGLQLPPRRLIRPRPGWLALFPSYVWHGTVPFSSPEPRLTIAFDVKMV